MKLVSPFFFTLISLSLFGQVSLIKNTGNTLEAIQNYTVEKQDNQKLKKEYVGKAFGALTFAKSVDVSLNCEKNGSWESIPNNQLMWRMRIQSENASSLNLAFDKYVMPKGGYMILFSEDKNFITGPFTDFDNKTNGQLWSPIIPSADIFIQVVIPENSEKALQLSIDKVNHGFLNPLQKSISQSCHLDVVCGIADGFPEVENYRDAIRSVGVYSIEGTRVCTGALINNTKNNCTPYFLTADHCGITQNNETSVVIHWNFENQTCRMPNSEASESLGNGSLDLFNSGAKLVASYPNSDMTLLELDSEVSVEANPFFAGWNISTSAPPKAVSIHHPNTDEKRISFENDPISVYSEDDQFWFVENWEIGSTESGSSGAPLFNEQQQIIGQIFGGEASCGNDLWDIFGRINVSWEGDGSAKGSLKPWLDPDQSGVRELTGRSCSALLKTSEKLINICNQVNTIVTITIEANNGFSSDANLSHETNNEGINVIFSEKTLGQNQSTMVDIIVNDSVLEGNYEVKLIADDGMNEAISFVTVRVAKLVPLGITRLSPDNAATVGTQLSLQWQDDYNNYDVELSKDSDFGISFLRQLGITSNNIETGALDQETMYYWRVRGINACGVGEWSNFSFETGKIECTIYTADDLPKIISEDENSTVISTISVPKNETISEVNVISIKGSHNWVGDLQFRLEGPSGKEIILINQECDNDKNFLIGFDDSAEFTFLCPLSDSMTHIPDAPLSTFIEDLSGGEWRLKVLDLEEIDGGSLDSWSIEICTNTSKNTVSTNDLMEDFVKIYPNPSQGLLFIDFSQKVSTPRYRIFDAVGAMRMNGVITSELNIEALESGLYFIELSEGNKHLGIKKIVVSK